MADRPSEWRQSLEEDHMSVEREEGLIPGVCNHPHAACPAADLLGGEDVARIAIAAGFSGEALITAVALAKAESTWDRCCFSATNDVGIWQINKVHWPNFGGRDNLYDANVNASVNTAPKLTPLHRPKI